MTQQYRPVPALDAVIHQEAYDWLLQYQEDILGAVETAIDQGFTPDEIYQHWLREAGWHRIELAKRCKNAAKHILRLKELQK